MSIEELLGNLKNVADNFFKYCHNDDCVDYYECPRQCCPRKKLGLDTAIAWIAAQRIKRFVEYYNEKNIKQNIESLFVLWTTLSSFFAVVSLHNPRYLSLYVWLNESMATTKAMMSELEDEK